MTYAGLVKRAKSHFENCNNGPEETPVQGDCSYILTLRATALRGRRPRGPNEKMAARGKRWKRKAPFGSKEGGLEFHSWHGGRWHKNQTIRNMNFLCTLYCSRFEIQNPVNWGLLKTVGRLTEQEPSRDWGLLVKWSLVAIPTSH